MISYSSRRRCGSSTRTTSRVLLYVHSTIIVSLYFLYLFFLLIISVSSRNELTKPKIVLFKACICYDFSFYLSIFLFSRGDTHGSNSVMAIVFFSSPQLFCVFA